MDQSDTFLKNYFPFAFPGSTPQEEIIEPPLHEDLEEFSFFELYEFIFNVMKPTESLLDTLKRIKNSNESLDNIAKWISELYSRGETDIFERDWIMIGISGGKISKILEMKWYLNS